MNDDLKHIEESKQRMRRQLAAHPVQEKLRMLDALRQRALTLKESRDQMCDEGRVTRRPRPEPDPRD